MMCSPLGVADRVPLLACVTHETLLNAVIEPTSSMVTRKASMPPGAEMLAVVYHERVLRPPVPKVFRIGAAPHGETRNRLLADLFEADHFLPAEGTMIEHSDFLAHDFTDPNLAPILERDRGVFGQGELDARHRSDAHAMAFRHIGAFHPRGLPCLTVLRKNHDLVAHLRVASLKHVGEPRIHMDAVDPASIAVGVSLNGPGHGEVVDAIGGIRCPLAHFERLRAVNRIAGPEGHRRHATKVIAVGDVSPVGDGEVLRRNRDAPLSIADTDARTSGDEAVERGVACREIHGATGGAIGGVVERDRVTADRHVTGRLPRIVQRLRGDEGLSAGDRNRLREISLRLAVHRRGGALHAGHAGGDIGVGDLLRLDLGIGCGTNHRLVPDGAKEALPRSEAFPTRHEVEHDIVTDCSVVEHGRERARDVQTTRDNATIRVGFRTEVEVTQIAVIEVDMDAAPSVIAVLEIEISFKDIPTCRKRAEILAHTVVVAVAVDLERSNRAVARTATIRADVGSVILRPPAPQRRNARAAGGPPRSVENRVAKQVVAVVGDLCLHDGGATSQSAVGVGTSSFLIADPSNRTTGTVHVVIDLLREDFGVSRGADRTAIPNHLLRSHRPRIPVGHGVPVAKATGHEDELGEATTPQRSGVDVPRCVSFCCEVEIVDALNGEARTLPRAGFEAHVRLHDIPAGGHVRACAVHLCEAEVLPCTSVDASRPTRPCLAGRTGNRLQSIGIPPMPVARKLLPIRPSREIRVGVQDASRETGISFKVVGAGRQCPVRVGAGGRFVADASREGAVLITVQLCLRGRDATRQRAVRVRTRRRLIADLRGGAGDPGLRAAHGPTASIVFHAAATGDARATDQNVGGVETEIARFEAFASTTALHRLHKTSVATVVRRFVGGEDHHRFAVRDIVEIRGHSGGIVRPRSTGIILCFTVTIHVEGDTRLHGVCAHSEHRHGVGSAIAAPLRACRVEHAHVAEVGGALCAVTSRLHGPDFRDAREAGLQRGRATSHCRHCVGACCRFIADASRESAVLIAVQLGFRGGYATRQGAVRVGAGGRLIADLGVGRCDGDLRGTRRVWIELGLPLLGIAHVGAQEPRVAVTITGQCILLADRKARGCRALGNAEAGSADAIEISDVPATGITASTAKIARVSVPVAPLASGDSKAGALCFYILTAANRCPLEQRNGVLGRRVPSVASGVDRHSRTATGIVGHGPTVQRQEVGVGEKIARTERGGLQRGGATSHSRDSIGASRCFVTDASREGAVLITPHLRFSGGDATRQGTVGVRTSRSLVRKARIGSRHGIGVFDPERADEAATTGNVQDWANKRRALRNGDLGDEIVPLIIHANVARVQEPCRSHGRDTAVAEIATIPPVKVEVDVDIAPGAAPHRQAGRETQLLPRVAIPAARSGVILEVERSASVAPPLGKLTRKVGGKDALAGATEARLDIGGTGGQRPVRVGAGGSFVADACSKSAVLIAIQLGFGGRDATRQGIVGVRTRSRLIADIRGELAVLIAVQLRLDGAGAVRHRVHGVGACGCLVTDAGGKRAVLIAAKLCLHGARAVREGAVCVGAGVDLVRNVGGRLVGGLLDAGNGGADRTFLVLGAINFRREVGADALRGRGCVSARLLRVGDAGLEIRLGLRDLAASGGHVVAHRLDISVQTGLRRVQGAGDILLNVVTDIFIIGGDGHVEGAVRVLDVAADHRAVGRTRLDPVQLGAFAGVDIVDRRRRAGDGVIFDHRRRRDDVVAKPRAEHTVRVTEAGTHLHLRRRSVRGETELAHSRIECSGLFGPLCLSRDAGLNLNAGDAPGKGHERSNLHKISSWAERRAEETGSDALACDELLGDALASLRAVHKTKIERQSARNIIRQIVGDDLTPILKLVKLIRVGVATTDDVVGLARRACRSPRVWRGRSCAADKIVLIEGDLGREGVVIAANEAVLPRRVGELGAPHCRRDGVDDGFVGITGRDNAIGGVALDHAPRGGLNLFFADVGVGAEAIEIDALDRHAHTPREATVDAPAKQIGEKRECRVAPDLHAAGGAPRPCVLVLCTVRAGAAARAILPGIVKRASLNNRGDLRGQALRPRLVVQLVVEGDVGAPGEGAGGVPIRPGTHGEAVSRLAFRDRPEARDAVRVGCQIALPSEFIFDVELRDGVHAVRRERDHLCVGVLLAAEGLKEANVRACCGAPKDNLSRRARHHAGGQAIRHGVGQARRLAEQRRKGGKADRDADAHHHGGGDRERGTEDGATNGGECACDRHAEGVAARRRGHGDQALLAFLTPHEVGEPTHADAGGGRVQHHHVAALRKMRADFGEQRPEGLEKRALAVLAQRKGCTTGGVILATIGFSRVSPGHGLHAVCGEQRAVVLAPLEGLIGLTIED
ncbi:hypothetical protein WR25_15773 [Diploscapter pachys]|uniref:Uncharacterized protein n=1 Tax=Diploscapter pachys TaxID=2018661 RepID=A0A2A2JXQ5_9BILA|nr:hypothetical protein WR25_15773 [Diploscapter pachys]